MSSDLTDSSERLRRLEALTDPALVHLDTEDLLHELIDRVERLLDVDTVAVLLLDPTGSALIASAARGWRRRSTRVSPCRWVEVSLVGSLRPKRR